MSAPVEGGAVAELDERDDLFTEPVARPSDDEGVEHVGMPADRFLDFFDEDLLAAAVDDERVASEQADRAVGRERRPIAGYREPAPVDDRERLLGAFAVVEVAERDATDARGPADLVVSRLEEARAVRREHHGAGGRLELLGLRALGGRAERHPSRLRRAVAVDDHEVRQQFEQRVLEVRARHRAARGELLQGREVVGVLSQRVDDRSRVRIADDRRAS